jgi:hypothetical protein
MRSSSKSTQHRILRPASERVPLRFWSPSRHVRIHSGVKELLFHSLQVGPHKLGPNNPHLLVWVLFQSLVPIIMVIVIEVTRSEHRFKNGGVP